MQADVPCSLAKNMNSSIEKVAAAMFIQATHGTAAAASAAAMRTVTIEVSSLWN
jgi:hypothetical protein